MSFDNAGIGGYPVPGLESDHIAGNQFCAADFHSAAIPYDGGLMGCHFLERFDGLLRSIFLKKTENRVHDKNGDNHNTVDIFPEHG